MFQLPFVREQFQQFLMSCLFIIRHSGDDIIQVFSWVYIMCLTGGQQGADNRHIDCRLMVAAEEVIFPSQSYRPTFMASMIGPASSRRFVFRSSYERLALSQQCSIRYICCIWVRACSAISLFSSRACSKWRRICTRQLSSRTSGLVLKAVS